MSIGLFVSIGICHIVQTVLIIKFYFTVQVCYNYLTMIVSGDLHCHA